MEKDNTCSVLSLHDFKCSQESLLEKLLMHLKATGILNDADVTKVKALMEKEGSQSAWTLLLCVLQHCGPYAFDAFCSALEVSKAELLLAQLPPKETGANENCPPPDDAPQASLGTGSGTERPKDLKLEERDDDGDGNCVSQPTPKDIATNDDYYFVEKFAFSDNEVKQPKGVLADLKVSAVGTPPIVDFNSHEVYPNFTCPKGFALIMNNHEFYGHPPLSRPLPARMGTDVDALNMRNLLKNLGFSVSVRHDLDGQAMLAEMCRFALKDHSKTSCAVVVILSHGLDGGVYGVDGELVSIDKLISVLNADNCPSLRFKPKLFFLQACRGERHDCGVSAEAEQELNYRGCELKNLGRAKSVQEEKMVAKQKLADLDLAVAKAIQRKIPSEQDILICFATTPGYVSWRNSAKGSWFIQAVCQVFAEFAAKEHILEMLTNVNQLVADSFMSTSGYKQIPSLCSQLTRKFYFFPGIYGSISGTRIIPHGPC